VFEINVQNANVNEQQRFNDIVMSTLKQVAANGLAPEVVNGILNRIEFGLREGNTPQKGIGVFLRHITGMDVHTKPISWSGIRKIVGRIKKRHQQWLFAASHQRVPFKQHPYPIAGVGSRKRLAIKA
jgi:Zn-dependent M16 (insulinase) family peptidase